MPDTSQEHTDDIEQAITQWRLSLKDMGAEQRDELEDHLRSELEQLAELPLSPRERVILAADRLGDPAALGEVLTSKTHVTLRIPLWLLATLTVGLIPLGVVGALNGVRETYREIDQPVGNYLGPDLANLAEGMAEWLAVGLVIVAGAWVLWIILKARGLARGSFLGQVAR